MTPPLTIPLWLIREIGRITSSATAELDLPQIRRTSDMTQYEVKTPDGVVHRIEALTHVNDSLGLTLYVGAGSTAAIFPRFEWMRLMPAVVDTSTPSGTTESETTSGEVAAPAATGE